MPRVEGGGVFVDGPYVAAFATSSPGVTELVWNGWLPMYRLEGRSPDERARAHGVNVANRRLSVEAYAGFVGRWKAALHRCRTEAEVVALGRPARPQGPAEPGASRGERADIDAVDEGALDAFKGALAEAARVRARLAGRRLPLEVTVDAKLGVRVELGAAACTAGASAARAVDAGCRAPAGGGAGLEADGTALRTVAAGPASATLAGDRLESVELSRGPAYVRLGRSSAAVGLGGQRALSSGPGGARASVEARLGVEVQLLDAETVRRALSREDHWAEVPGGSTRGGER